ncbi:unnamed protein product [Prunus brigantina]
MRHDFTEFVKKCSYPFPKGGRIVTQLPIRSVLREMQGDNQSIPWDVQNTPGVPQGGPRHS